MQIVTMSRNIGIMSWKVKRGGFRVQILTMNRNVGTMGRKVEGGGFIICVLLPRS